jgi:CMP/dCMP kinase
MRRARYIAIDGPAGTGKSTVGARLAQFLDYLYLDTGAMYRALTWLALKKGVDLSDGNALSDLCKPMKIAIVPPCFADRQFYTISIDGEDITRALHDQAVTRSVPLVAGYPQVRRLLRDRQRALAHEGPIVMVGRDIGTVVLPDADLKFFLTASLEERAHRRYRELLRQRDDQYAFHVSLEEIRQEIHRRDERDRKHMTPAPDAHIIDTSHLDVMEVSHLLYRYAEFVPDNE